MSVKVAVRLRPFNDRQKRLDSKLVINMQNPTTILKANGKQPQRRFVFDYSFWSFDGYEEEQNGYLKAAPESKYADQQYVFKQVGRKVLQNAFKGYNCSLFAYGQTGAGKSYSMIGYGVNKGIVPIICQQIFKKANQKSKDQQFEVYVSMIEIYNQEIQDLTVDISQRPTGGLKIRQNRLLGVFVQGIKKHFVDDYQDIQKIMEQGARNRTVAVTQMNASSSRAHTMISIQFKQKIMVKNVKTQKISVLNLVDLAGSQRQSKTGATGQRLKQAAGINLSLTVLGQVITSLCDSIDGQNKFIPYRNASLTRILQNALGGNSQTIMICAVSPSENNYDQTLSTLRFAQKAKKIKNKPVVNEQDTDKLIKQINIQNQKIQQKLIQAESKRNSLANNPKTIEEIQRQQKQIQEMKANANALKELLQEEKQTKKQKKDKQNQNRINNKLLAKQANKDQQRILDRKQIQTMKKANTKFPPYFQIISKDIIIHKKLNILIQKDHITVGKPNCDPPNDILFGGRDMRPKHATIDVDSQGNVFLTPLATGIHLYVNGQKVDKKTNLKDLDRVIFGWNSVFIFRDMQHPRTDSKVAYESITWQFAGREVARLVNIDDTDTEENQYCCKIF